MWPAIVEREGVGLVFKPEDVEQLVEGLLRLHADAALRATLKASGLLATGRYDRKHLAAAMLKVLEQAAGCQGSSLAD